MVQKNLILDLLFSYYLEEREVNTFPKWRMEKIGYSIIIHLLFFIGLTR